MLLPNSFLLAWIKLTFDDKFSHWKFQVGFAMAFLYISAAGYFIFTFLTKTQTQELKCSEFLLAFYDWWKSLPNTK